MNKSQVLAIVKTHLGMAALLWCGAALAQSFQLSKDGNSVVRINSISSVSSASFDEATIRSLFPDWTVTKAAAVTGSVITLDFFAPTWKMGSVLGGANFGITYSQPNAVPTGSSLNWVQFVTSNVAISGSPPGSITTVVDNAPSHPGPMYWPQELQGVSQPTSRTTNFQDGPLRASSNLNAVSTVNWDAKVYQVEYDGSRSIVVHDGKSWGWTMKPATVGDSSGKFVNPSPACPPATCSGLGGTSVTWGVGDPGSLSFAANSFSPKTGDLFKVGTLTYHNGATNAGSEISEVGLDIALAFTNAAELSFIHRARLSINNTPNTDDPVASADYVYFTTGGFTNSFRVLEGSTASADLMAKLTPLLGTVPAKYELFPEDRDPVTPSDSTTIGYELVLVGFANPTVGGFIGVVPEPSIILLALFGGIVIFQVYRQRLRSSRG